MAGYEIPSWIRPPGNLAQDYLSGLQAGSQIAHQRAALQQQAQISAVNAQVQQQQLQMQAERQRQQIEMQRAYHDQVTSLRQQQLAEQQQKIQTATQMAASKFAAQQAYSKRVQSGEDPAKVLLELGPAMGASAGDLGAALKSTKEVEQKKYGDITSTDIGGGYKAVYRTGSPGVHVVPPQKQPAISLQALATAARALPELQMTAKREGPGSTAAKMLRQIEAAMAGQGGGAGQSVITHRVNPKTGKIEKVPSPDQIEAAPQAAPGLGIPEEQDDAEY